MNNEEKILALLEALNQKVDNQGEQLALHSTLLAQQNEQLAQHSTLLAQQNEQLAQHSTLLARQNEQLTQHSTLLAQQGEQLKTMNERLDELDERSLRSAVMLENQVLPQLQALYEGHGAIMEKMASLASQEQVNEHESDISIMKDAITLLRMDVNELKKAQ